MGLPALGLEHVVFTRRLPLTTIAIIFAGSYYKALYMDVDQNPCCRRAPPLLQTFVAGPLLQTLVADLWVEYCSLQGACRGRVCSRTPPSVTNLCREMAALACYKANVFDSLLYRIYG